VADTTHSSLNVFDLVQNTGEATLSRIGKCQSLEDLDAIRVEVLGKKGSLSEALKGVGGLPPSDRPKVGAVVNEWKGKIEEALSVLKESLESKAIESSMEKDRIDPTLPGRRLSYGTLHPITQTTRDLIRIFSRIGFEVSTGPEVESDYFNFQAVNIPEDHPARDMQDTFFLAPGVVLRTQTSPVQMREMQSRPWPVRIICPGAVFRVDSDATHSPMFHQLEGLCVDKSVTMADLKGTLSFFVKELFGSSVRIRLRPSYFPFVEPGAEVDVSCAICDGKDSACRVCKGTGWLEILGAGMVHPKLFKEAGYEGDEVSGFAFGLGIDRIAMLRHEIPDLRLFFSGDRRFLSRF
jgi:phenylalanyl-tRNA synthetase alpha chain